MSTEKKTTMPTNDELFDAFLIGLEEGMPPHKKGLVEKFKPFLNKLKDHIDIIFASSEDGLSLNFTEETGNELLQAFIGAQNMLLRVPLKGILKLFGADTFSHFVQDTKEGKNNRDTTVGGIVDIMIGTLKSLSANYLLADTPDSVREKITKIFTK